MWRITWNNAWQASLTAEQRQAVAEHERGHLRLAFESVVTELRRTLLFFSCQRVEREWRVLRSCLDRFVDGQPSRWPAPEGLATIAFERIRTPFPNVAEDVAVNTDLLEK